LEFFFGYEALALAERQNQNDLEYKTATNLAQKYYDQLSVDDKSWCEPILKKIY